MILYKVVFPILYIDLACKHLCLLPGNGINKRNESTDLEPLEPFLSHCSTDDSNQY